MSDNAKLHLIEISRIVGDSALQVERDGRRPTATANDLIYVQAGTYHARTAAGHHLRSTAGEGVIYPADDQHRWLNAMDGSSTLLIMRWRGAWDPPRASVFTDPNRFIGTCLRRLDDLTELDTPDPIAYRRTLCAAVLHELRCQLAGATTEDDIALRLRRHLQLNYGQAIDLDHLVQRYGMSRATLCRRFRARWGTSPMEYLLALRVDRALTLLAEPGQTLAAIAAATGFRSPSTLAQAIKRRTGQPPRYWRRQGRRVPQRGGHHPEGGLQSPLLSGNPFGQK